jgi:ABC-type Na+ transport system ATPase subunit NatA
MTLAVQVNSLVKKYGSNTAVDNISFNIYKGEVFGLLGPNGAGKTTTLEIIEGLRMPTLGEVYVEGLSPIRDTKELRKVLGVQLQISTLPEVMRVDEAMELICTFKGIKPRYDLLERFGLVKQKKQQYGKLSTGQKRRLQLALAICGNPKVVILDEPTAGVDVQGRAQLHNAIRELRKNGVTWSFEKDAEGWRAANNMTFEVKDGKLECNITGQDAYMMKTDLSVPLEKYNAVKIRYMNTTNSTRCQVYFTTTVHPNIAGQFKMFTLKSNMTDFEEIVLDMSNVEKWIGNLTRLRFDPADSASSGVFYFDEIELVNIP